MELVIYTPKENDFIQEIKFNYEEIATYLNNELEKYKIAIYNDNTIKTAKDDRARLNKLKAAFDTKRKEIKELCLKPYRDFEEQINRLISLVDEPILAIDAQVKDYENRGKNLKQQGIEEFYNETIDNLKEVLPLKRIWNERWLNITYKMSDIIDEIIAVIEKFKQDIVTIEGLKTEYELQVKDVYIQTLDLSKALNENARLIEQKKRLEAIKPTPAVVETKNQTITGQVSIEQLQQTKEEETGEVLVRDFRVWATKTQMEKLRNFLIINNIKYGKVKE